MNEGSSLTADKSWLLMVQDEWSPRLVETLTNRLAVPEGAMVGAGGNASFCDATSVKTLYAWGKLKISGDGQMYPQAFMDMAGWNVRSIACGPATYAIAAEKSAVTWGAAHNNELAYGRNGKKSSANPAKVMNLEGYYTHQVRAEEACHHVHPTLSCEPDQTLQAERQK
jgi:hypothetical protein